MKEEIDMDKFEQLSKQLNKLVASKHALNSKEVVELSQKLDKLIVKRVKAINGLPEKT